MSGATAELVRLIDLSLGNQPSGAVNFNYLHTLMHAIVGRLGSIEHAYLADGAVDGLILPATGEIAGGGAGTAGGGVDASAGGGRAGERTTTAAGVGGREMKTGEPSGTEGKEGAVTSGTSQEPGKAEEAVASHCWRCWTA